jgi:hypothetical protein
MVHILWCEVVRIVVACRCVFQVCSREACEVRFGGNGNVSWHLWKNDVL